VSVTGLKIRTVKILAVRCEGRGRGAFTIEMSCMRKRDLSRGRVLACTGRSEGEFVPDRYGKSEADVSIPEQNKNV
jgi:hypothetical protein